MDDSIISEPPLQSETVRLALHDSGWKEACCAIVDGNDASSRAADTPVRRIVREFLSG